MSTDRVQVRDRAVASLSLAFLPPEIAEGLSALSAPELLDRCRRAVAEVDQVAAHAPAITLQRGTALALFGAGWMLAVSPALKARLRAILMELHRGGDPEDSVSIHREETVETIKEVLREWQ